MKRLLLITFTLIVIPSASYAWNYEGHMVFVAIAYDTLTDDERQNIDVVLQNHPSYNFWKQDFQQLGADPGLTLPQYAFLRAANWPDDVRGNPTYHRPTWHYVNFPLKPPNSLNTDVNIGGDLLTQIQNNLNRVNSQPTTNAKKIQRAIALSWVLHQIGDLHQPLHTGALRNSRYRQGDHGGNFFFVRPTAQAHVTNLHSFWDGLLGRSRDAKFATAFGQTLASRFPQSSLSELMGGDYRSWAKESAKIALDETYQFTPQGEPRRAILGSSNENSGPVLPDGYEIAARQVAWKRVALGGYRLGNMLKEIF